MKYVVVGLVILATAFFWRAYRGPQMLPKFPSLTTNRQQLHQETPQASTSPLPIEKLKRPLKFEALDSISRKRLMDATLGFCIAKYHRESCVHYLIVCGPPCTKLLTPESFARVRQDYWLLAGQVGIRK